MDVTFFDPTTPQQVPRGTTVRLILPGLSTEMLLSIAEGLTPDNPLYRPVLEQLQLRFLRLSVELDRLRQQLAAAQAIH